MSPEDVRAYRDGLDIGQIEIFQNHLGQTTGRAWSLDQSMKHIFNNPELVSLLNFNADAPVGPHLIWSFHNDGAQQTAYSSFVAFLSRLISLDAIARVPASILINGIDETKESPALFKKFWERFVMPSVRKVEENGGCVSVLCLNSLDPSHQYFGTCKLCELNHEKFGTYDETTSLKYHLVLLFFIYCMDIKAFKCLLPINDGQCVWCETALRTKTHSFMNDVENKAQQREVGKLECASKEMALLFEKFKEEKEDNMDHLAKIDDEEYIREKFYESSLYKQYVNQDENAQYKGELCDEVTPIDQYIADSLHVGLRTGDFAQSIVMVQAQRVENLYRGTGVHAYHGAACCTGFKHFGEKMKAYCKGELKAKVRTLNALTAPQASSLKDAGNTMSFSGECVHEFKAMLSKPSVTKGRLQEILEVTRKFSTHLVKGPKPKKSAVSSTSKADLVKAICIELDKISDDDIVIKHIMSPEEKSKIDCALQLRLYEEVVVEGS